LVAALLLIGVALLGLRLRGEPGLSPLGLIGLEPPLERPGGRIVTVLQRGIWTVDATTGERQRLRPIPTGREPSQVAWSPDGSRLAVSEIAYPATQTLGIGGLYVVPASGGEPTTLLMEGAAGTRFEQPTWTADGAAIVYFYSRFPGAGGDGAINRIERVGLADGTRTALVDDAFAPGLSHDGQSLAFVRRGAAGETLWVTKGSPDAARQVVPERRFLSIAYPRFSRDGNSLAFAATDWPLGSRPPADAIAEQPRSARLLHRAEGGAPSPVTGIPVAWPGAPVSALTASLGALGAVDAARAALAAAGRPSAHGLPWDLWVIQRDGSGLRRLTRLAEDDASLAWSPDGAWLAFQGTGGLYLVHQESGRMVRLADKTEPVGIDWAP
jgi:Tol biopolymer transport system component